VRAVLVVPQDLITTVSSATGLAHGIGTASGPRAAGSETHERLPRPVTGPTAAAGPAGDDVPEVTERTPTGLPQRRRKARAVAPTAPAATAAPATQAAPETGEAASATASGTASAPAVQPGMWLAAFQSGLSGDTTQPSKGNKQP
jgi:hypothetical protein